MQQQRFRTLAAAIFVGLFLFSSCDKLGNMGGGAKTVDLKSNEQKASYAIGLQIGNGLKSQGLKVEVDALSMAISDVLSGKEPRISMQEQQAAIQSIQQSVMAEQKKEAAKTLAEGNKFLEENKKKEGVKTTKSGLQYEVITEGKGKIPGEKDRVKVHYKGTLINGSEFDSSYSRGKPAEFPVGGVIRGWTEALQMMKVGSKYKLYLPSDLAYGPQGQPKIPANSVLVFEVELLDIVTNKK